MTARPPLTSRADLVRALAFFEALDADAQAMLATSLGLSLMGAPTKGRDSDAGGRAGDTDGRPIVEGVSTVDVSAEGAPDLLPTPFWQARTLEIFDEQRLTEFERTIAEEAAATGADIPSRYAAPAPTHLSPWRRLGPLLQRALNHDKVGRALDVPELVRRWTSAAR